MKHLRSRLGAAAVAFGLALGAGWTAQAQDLPDQMIWSAYDIGSSGYADASAVADALMTNEGTRIRILPSGTSIGRLLPLKTGRVDYGWLANEVYFATEAIYDFASREWGPQDLRVVLGRPATYGLATTQESGVDSIADLKGKRVAFIKANPSINIKNEAILAFGGLTRDDVEEFVAPSYAAAIRALIEGDVVAAGGVPASALFRELEASPRGIKWIDIDPDNDAGWERLREVASFFAPAQATVGAGLSEDNPGNLISYRYPMITVYADRSEDEVYNFIKAVHENFEAYKDARPTMPWWHIENAGVPPADAPFHPGAVRFLKEQGVWTDEHDAWNERRLARMEAVQEAWDAASEEAYEENVSDSDWPEFWDKYRAQALGD